MSGYQQIALIIVDEAEMVLKKVKEELGSADPEAMRKNLEENDSGKVAAVYQFQHFYEKGDETEKVKNYDKAVMTYQSALEQMEILENMGEQMGRLTFADIYDRIAFCYEMSGEYEGAKEYYMRALLEAASEAKETETVKAYYSAINYAWKLASFCEEFGDEEAKKHYAFREFLVEEKSKLESDDDESDEDFLSPEMKAELRRKLDELDFTPATYRAGEKEDYSEGLFTD